MIRMKDIIACFENPVYGTVEKINDYTISIYDKKFDLFVINDIYGDYSKVLNV